MTRLQRSIRRALAVLVVLAGLLVGAAVNAPGDGPSGEARPRALTATALEGAIAGGSLRARAAQFPPPTPTPAPAPAPTPAPAPAPTPAPGWEPGLRSARTYARTREGTVSFAVRTTQRTWSFGGHRVARSASVVKAMLLVAFLNEPEVRRRALTATERGLLAPMIRWSSNDAATAVRNVVGDDGLRRVAARAGMADFASAPAWGLSSITASDQSRFFLRIDSYVPRRHRAYALRLLRTIVPEQRWGLGRVVPEGWRLHLKGGWGSGSGAVNHQVALLRRGEERVSVAILTTGNPTHDYGSETLRGVGKRLLRGLADLPEDGLLPTARAPVPR